MKKMAIHRLHLATEVVYAQERCGYQHGYTALGAALGCHAMECKTEVAGYRSATAQANGANIHERSIWLKDWADGKTEIVALLLNNGANINKETSSG